MRGSHTDAVTSLAVNPQGTLVASGSRDSTVRLWDAVHGTPAAVLSGHTHWVEAVAFSKDGKRVLSAGYDETVRSWDTTSGGSGQVLAKLGSPATTLAASSTEPLVVFAGWKGPLHLWNLDEGKEQRMLGEEHRTHRAQAVFSPDGRRLFEVREDGNIGAWDVASGRRLLPLGIPGIQVTDIAGGGDTLFSVTEEDVLQFWKISSGESIAQVEPHQGRIGVITVSPDGLLAISLGSDATLRIWDCRTGALVDRIDFPPRGDTPSAVLFEPGSRAFLVGTQRGLVLRYVLESP